MFAHGLMPTFSRENFCFITEAIKPALVVYAMRMPLNGIFDFENSHQKVQEVAWIFSACSIQIDSPHLLIWIALFLLF